jgi:hypothetical protein
MQKQTKLTESQVKLKKYLKPIVEGILNEKPTLNEAFDPNDTKWVLQYVNALASVPIRHLTNDANIKQITDKIDLLRIELMRYVEDNTNYKFYGKSGTGWTLKKK